MKYLQLKRIATLFSFVILMSSFIAYRTGAFEKLYNRNASNLDSNEKANADSKKVSAVDTPPVFSTAPIYTVSSTPVPIPAYISSSKSAQIVDPAVMAMIQKTLYSSSDSGKKILHPDTDFRQPTQQELTIMASSKSIGIVPAHAQIVDLTPKDTTPKISSKELTILSSSKSASIYTPPVTTKKPDTSKSK